MSTHARTTSIAVRLEGGPSSIPDALRTTWVANLDETVKVEHLGGYEHFRLHRDEGETGTVVFRWIGRTRIAE